MTFCVGVKVAGGLVGLADTRIVKGSETSSKAKVARLHHDAGSLFLMTSGLRSVRDKAYAYFEQEMAATEPGQVTRMFQVANLFGAALRRVREEDGAALQQSGFAFNLNAIIGGKFSDDPEPALLYVYPEGNWVEATADAPYHIIGRTTYGKPILDRLLTAQTSLGQALALSFLAFDATRTSVTDVDFPVDIVVLDAATRHLNERRFDAHELALATSWWQETLRSALGQFPLDWASQLLPAPNPYP